MNLTQRRRRRSQASKPSARSWNVPDRYAVIEPLASPKVSYRQNSYRAVSQAGTVKRASLVAASAAAKSLKNRQTGRNLQYKLATQPGPRPVTRKVGALKCKPRPSPGVKTRGSGASRKPFVPWCR